MQLEFTKLVIENFMSWKFEEIELPSSGTILIEGLTTDEDGHESNGAGKSSIFDALTWCLFGKGLRQVGGVFPKGAKLINRQSKKNCRVDLYFNSSGVSYILRRAQKHSEFKGLSLYRGSVSQKTDISGPSIRATQSEVEKLLGMSHSVWTQSVFFGEGISTKFTGITPAQRVKTLESLVGLDEIDEIGRKARRVLRDHEVETARLSSRKDLLKRELELKVQEFKSHREDAQKFESARQSRLSELSDKISYSKKCLRALKKKESSLSSGDSFSSQKAKLDKKIDSLHLLSSKMTNSLDSMQSQISFKNGERRRLQSEITRRQKEIETHRDRVGTQCPTCEQEISEEHCDKCIEACRALITEAETQRDSVKTKIDGLVRKRETLLSKRSKIYDRITKLDSRRTKLEEAETELKNLLREIQYETSTLESLTSRLEDESSRKNTHETRQKKARKDAKRLRHELLGVHQEHQLKVDDRQYISFWVDALGTKPVDQMKPLRSFVIESLVPFLNESVKSFTTSLTQNEMTIEFSTSTVLASGKIKDQFNVDVSKRHGGDSYDLSSNGERRRADICIAAALQSLVATRRRRQTTFRIYDELFDGLDGAGIERVVDMLSRFPGPTFVITHRSGLADHFDVSWQVIKTSGFSTLKK